jgi:thioredoxin
MTIMKNIAIISFLSFFLFFTACSNSNGSKPEGASSENSEGTVVQMSSDMFKKLVWDYEKNPNDFKFSGELPIVIDFYATWCRPCKMVAPIMEDLAKEYKGKIRIYKVDTDQEAELSRLFNIRSIPAILYVPKTGQPQMSVGMSDKDTYMKTIQDVLLGGVQKQ